VIPYGRQSVGEDDVAAVLEVLRGDWLTQGPTVGRFEEALAARVEARFAVAFSSGTAALHAAASVAGLGSGDTVATSALTFIASANCARYVGASVALVDIDPATLNLDPARVPDCDALVAVHLAGLPVDLAGLAHRPRVVIEDAAHALGASTPDGPVGNCARSEMCVFSFHPVKAITTGEGGAVTTNSEDLAERLRSFRNHGYLRDPEKGGWYYEARAEGGNHRLTDIQAALGTSQLAKLDAFVERRNQLAARYRAALADAPLTLPPEAPPGWRHAYHLFCVRVAERRAVYEALRARGVGVQVHYVPLYRHPVLALPPTAAGECPETESAYAGLLSLPLFPALTDAEQDEVIAAVREATGDRSQSPPDARPAGGGAEDGRPLARSREWWARASALIPAGTQTLSKGPTQFVQGPSPIFLARGEGAHVWDVDGNRYLDYPMALGPVILGYGDPSVDAAIRRQLEDGITFSLPHPLEVEVAERIVALCPGVEAVRFGKSGSDAVSAAVRAARALTGRDIVLVAGYHGWHDWYAGATARAAGVPEAVRGLVHTFRFNDAEDLARALDEHRGQVAAVVLEPSAAEAPANGYLQRAVELAGAHGALSVFDEVITGFRLAPGGARQRYGVEPDLSCYGKALGNGMPISAVAGSWDAMRAFEEVFFSLTHGGETLSLAAARAVLDAIADGEVLAGIERRGLRLRDGIASLAEGHGLGARVAVSGEPQRAVVRFTGADPLADRSFVQQCLVERSILFNGSMFVCARHRDEDVEYTLEAFDQALGVLAEHDDVGHLLAGAPVQPVFPE
jgi:dTDP-4-amino-4,6-dideoxygalactose transaminase/glutamate-1-semialdehyde aminotransferase